MDLFSIPMQCCDAKHYLAMGEGCAIGEGCYNILRPMGAVYWFSIPYRFQLPLDSLVILHYLLTLISVVLSMLVTHRMMTENSPIQKTTSSLVYLPSFLLSLLVHSIFLHPVIRHSLSDPPSSLLFLIGLWLLFLLPLKIIPRIMVLFTAGLLFGLAAWIRSFFLYPLLFALVFWLLYTAITGRFQLHKIILLVALTPIVFQFYTTWKKTGALSYIHPSEASIHQGLILKEKASGYDTVLPGVGFRTYPSCQNYRALGEALQTVDFYSLGCLLSGKLHYYLGSYSPNTFWVPELKDINRETAINLTLPETPSNAIPLRIANIEKEKFVDASRADANDILKVWKEDNGRDSELSYTVTLKEGITYFPSFQAWTNENHQVILFSIQPQGSDQNIYSTFKILSQEPQLFQLGISNHDAGEHDLVISFPFIDPSINEDAQKIIAAGGKINHGIFFISDMKLAEADSKDQRYWFPSILFANLLAILLCVTLVYQKRHDWTSEHWMTFLLVLLCCAEALIITPEQRFVIAPMIFAWILCIGWSGRIILRVIINRGYLHGSV